MTTAQLSRGSARRLTVLMLVIAVGGVAGVAALAVGGEGRLPEPPKPRTTTQEKPVDEPDETPPPPRRNPVEVAEEIGYGLSDIYAWATEEETPVDATPPEEDEPEEIARESGSIRYLGSIIGPERRLAIVSIDGTQRIIAEQTVVDGYRLQRVESDHIVVRQGNRSPMEIGKAAPSGSMVTVLASKGDARGPGGPDRGIDRGMDRDEAEGEDAESVLDRNERLRQEMLERRRERLGARADELDALKSRREQNNAGAGGSVATTPGVRGTVTGADGTSATTNRGSTGRDDN